MKLFEIERPLYGFIRGEIISVMNCTENTNKVLSTTDFCTEELQVDDGYGGTAYVNAGSNILKNEMEKKECEVDGLGNIYKVQNKKNEEIFIHQESKVIEFSKVTANLQDYVGYFLENFQFHDLLNYISFGHSGIYDAAFLTARNSYIFSGERYRSAQLGITNAITDNNRKWKQAANQDIDLSEYISPDQLLDIIVGNFYLQWIYFVLQICGYIGGFAFLTQILYANCKERISCPSITVKNSRTVNNVGTIKTRMLANDLLQQTDEDTDEDEFLGIQDCKIRCRKMPSLDPPPPYNV